MLLRTLCYPPAWGDINECLKPAFAVPPSTLSGVRPTASASVSWVIPRLRRAALTAAHAVENETQTVQDKAQWETLVEAWTKAIAPHFAEIERIAATTAVQFPAWNAPYVDAWKPSHDFSPVARLPYAAIMSSCSACTNDTSFA